MARWIQLLLLGCVGACGGDPTPPAPTEEPPPAAARGGGGSAAVASGGVVRDVAGRLLAGRATEADRQLARTNVKATVAAILADAVVSDPVQLGRAPGALMALGDAALPAIADGLAAADVRQRRLAATTLLQLGADLHSRGLGDVVAAALRRAQSDPDPAVAAAAELALRRVTGDSSALDESRRQHEAAERGR